MFAARNFTRRQVLNANVEIFSFLPIPRYLQYEHYRHCVPSNVSSGFATLPLSHVWFDGKENTSFPTNKSLPDGHKLNGKNAYSMILPYFTTNDMSPMDVHNLGKKQLAILYPLVSNVAKTFLSSFCCWNLTPLDSGPEVSSARERKLTDYKTHLIISSCEMRYISSQITTEHHGLLNLPIPENAVIT